MVLILLSSSLVAVAIEDGWDINDLFYDTEEDAMYRCFITSDTTVEVAVLTLMKSNITKVTVPSSVTYEGKTYVVTGISNYAFRGFSTIKRITLPDTIEYIECGAFENCTKLTEIENFPTSLTSISNRMFYGCESLEEFDIPEGVTVIEDEVFYSCSSLKNVTLPNSLTTIGDYAFCCCYKLEQLTIPDSVTSIGDLAFYMCWWMQTTIPDSVTTFGDYAFYGCEGIKELTISSSLTSIGKGAFAGCVGLSELTVPNTVTTLGSGAFGYTDLDLLYFYIEDCEVDGTSTLFGDQMGTIIFGDDVRTIPNGMFRSCKAIDKIVYGDKIESIGSYAFANVELTSVPIPNTITSIGDHAFAGSYIERITIPNGVTAIEESMFSSCTDLLTVILGDAVETIGDYAFWKCENLTELFSPNPTPPVCGKNVFKYINSECVLYVPAESIEAYASAEGWKDFFDIRDMATNGIEAVAEDNVDNSITEIYTISGQRVDVAPKGVNIVRYADGTTKKIINK